MSRYRGSESRNVNVLHKAARAAGPLLVSGRSPSVIARTGSSSPRGAGAGQRRRQGRDKIVPGVVTKRARDKVCGFCGGLGNRHVRVDCPYVNDELQRGGAT